jgi:lactate dehydrogenase-like 2-hydroxyacid dehydrogenase
MIVSDWTTNTLLATMLATLRHLAFLHSIAREKADDKAGPEAQQRAARNIEERK